MGDSTLSHRSDQRGGGSDDVDADDSVSIQMTERTLRKNIYDDTFWLTKALSR